MVVENAGDMDMAPHNVRVINRIRTRRFMVPPLIEIVAGSVKQP
jgi:hypothetical protein